MASYDDVRLMSFTFPEWDFGDGDTVDNLSFRLPTGRPGRLVKIGVMVSETFACDSTAAQVEIGTAADPDAYAKLVIADGAADVDFFDETDDTDAIISGDIAADTLIEVTPTAGADSSTAAGKGLLVLEFEVYGGP